MTLLVVAESQPIGARLAELLGEHYAPGETVRIATIDEASAQSRYVDVIVLAQEACPAGKARDLIVRVRELAPDVPVIVWAAPEDDTGELLDLIGIGIQGYCLTDQPVEHFVRSIRDVQNGETCLDPRIAMQLVEQLRDLRSYLELCGYEIDPVVEPLTRREREVLSLVEQGLSNKEIAEQLYIEIGTVKNHVHNILNKLGARDRDQAVRHFHTHFTSP